MEPIGVVNPMINSYPKIVPGVKPGSDVIRFPENKKTNTPSNISIIGTNELLKQL